MIPGPIVRFDKETGEVIAIQDIQGPFGVDDEITAIAADLHGNYVVGGFTGENLFPDHPVVPAIYNSGGASDFFVAQLSHTDCAAPPPMGVAEERKMARPKVYPNPNNGKFTLSDLSGEAAKIRLYDIRGRLIYSKDLGKAKSVQMDLKGQLRTGIYFLEISILTTTEIIRVLIE